MPGRIGIVSTHLLGLAVGALDVAAEQQVEGLVGAAELDVGAHRDRVVALQQRVEQLEDRDRRAGGVALGEVVALEQLRDRRRAREAEEVLHRHVEPLAVEAHLEQLVVVAQDLLGLLLVRARVGVDLLAATAPGRVAERPLGSPTRAV